jgi:hypothetical protein
MNVEQFFEDVGGRKQVINETGLTKARISQMAVNNHIPDSWVKYFMLKYPEQCQKNGICEKQKAA